MHEVDSEATERWSAEVAVRAQFFDVDPMQVVWHGNYARFFEYARCALLDSIDYNYVQMKESGYAWPIIDMRTRFVQPIRFAQNVLVRAEVTEWTYRLVCKYLIRDAETGIRLTTGTTTQVAVAIDTGAMCLQSPSVLFKKLGVAEPW